MKHSQGSTESLGPVRWCAAALGIAVLALLAASHAVAGLAAAGPAYQAAALLGFLPVAATVIRLSPRRPPGRRFGPANGATLARGVIAGLLAGLVATPEALTVRAGPVAWLPTLLVALGLLLDLADGRLARRRNLVSEFGARFDLAVDAWTTLVLAGLAVTLGAAPPWALAIGLLHYLVRAAALVVPALSAPQAPSLRRRLIGGAQAIALGMLLAPPFPERLAPALAGAALSALAVSFAIDLHRLWRNRTHLA